MLLCIMSETNQITKCMFQVIQVTPNNIVPVFIIGERVKWKAMNLFTKTYNKHKQKYVSAVVLLIRYFN